LRYDSFEFQLLWLRNKEKNEETVAELVFYKSKALGVVLGNPVTRLWLLWERHLARYD
jgi:hypothetical protein